MLTQIPQDNAQLREQCFKIAHQKLPDGDLDPKCLKEAIRGVLALVHPAVLVVDALDECTLSTEALKEWLDEIKTLPQLQVVITSRPLERIEEMAVTSLAIRLELSSVIEKSNDDIRRFIEHRLQKSTSLSSLTQRTVDALAKKSNVRTANKADSLS